MDKSVVQKVQQITKGMYIAMTDWQSAQGLQKVIICGYRRQMIDL